MPPSLQLVFCGTPNFAVPSLERLAAAEFDIRLVVTQPDRPKGRGLESAISPVKQRSLESRLPITQPDKIRNNDEFRAKLKAIAPDAIVVVGYGHIIPQWMLEIPPLGNINLHASLLPKYRGAAPIQWAIARGESVTGVTTMKINAGLDTGDILLQRELPIAADDTSEMLAPRLASIGADLLLETLRGLQSESVHARPQDHAQSTLAPILKKQDGLIDFSRSATEIVNRLRGFQPWPGAYTIFRGHNLQIRKAAPITQALAPGQLQVEDKRLLVGSAHNSALELFEVQPEGKKRMSARDFVNGYRPTNAEKLGRL
jgi:methionyl-tRNA formyltransferase